MRISDWSSDVCSSDLRESQSFLAPAIQHCQPVNLRQTKIQDNRVIALRRAKKMPLFAIGGEVDGVAYPFKSVFQLLAQMGLVLNNQQQHRSEARRVVNKCVSTLSSRWSPYHTTTN